MRVITFMLALAMLPGTLFAAPEKYAIDIPGQHAFIQFKIKHLGYSWLLGDFRKFDGSFVFDPENPANNSVTVTVDTASLDSNHAERDKHLKGPDFLDVKRFPEATFNSETVSVTEGGKMLIEGKLSLHGVTKDIVISASEIGRGSDPWGGYRAGFEGSTTLTLADFGITKNLGPASTQVQMLLFIEGVKQ
jgi:polyisoprenoid-binding protein YceI